MSQYIVGNVATHPRQCRDTVWECRDNPKCVTTLLRVCHDIVRVCHDVFIEKQIELLIV